mgnify:CR=1 FL=1
MKQTVFAVITVASLFLGATSCSQQPSAKDQTTVPAEFTISKEKLGRTNHRLYVWRSDGVQI